MHDNKHHPLQVSVPGSDADSGGFDAEHTPYQAIGGEQVVRAIVQHFYDEMSSAAEFAPTRRLYPQDLEESREKLFMFLSGWLGGPQLYMNTIGHPRLRMRHAPFAIGTDERDQWLACMKVALDKAGVTGDVRSFLDQRFSHVAGFLVNK